MASLQTLEPRPGMVDAFTKIYPSGEGPDVQVWGATNGSMELAKKLFSSTLSSGGGNARLSQSREELSKAGPGAVGLYSCDQDRVAKPDPRVYTSVLDRIQDKSLSSASKGSTSTWFVASHTWDLFAARNAGFQHTAWVAYEEFYDCHDIYGTPDIVGKDMADVAQKILDFEAAGKR